MVRTLLLLTVRGRRAFKRRRAVVVLTGTAFPRATGGRPLRQGMHTERIGVSDTLRLPEGGGFQPRLASRCRFAVHRPGNPVASPRSYGVPGRGVGPGHAYACLAIADTFEYIFI
jgi:hypothetical protein